MLTIESNYKPAQLAHQRGQIIVKPIAPPKSLMELTADRIRDAIIDGEFDLGSKVSEQKLADTLGISRSPVREALALLQIEGLVRVLPKRGTFIFLPDEKSVKDLCEHRAILECACLELAITRNHGALVGGLQNGIEMMQRAIERSSAVDFSAGDLRFHRAIVDASDNKSIAKIYTSTIGPLMALRTHLFTTMTALQGRSMAEHAALLNACEKHDLATAKTVLTEHVFHLHEAFRDQHDAQNAPTQTHLSVIK